MQIIKSIYKNNLFLIILWIISIFVFVGTIFLHDTVGYSSIKRIAYENINYNNHSNDLKLSAFKEFSELDKSDYKEINT